MQGALLLASCVVQVAAAQADASGGRVRLIMNIAPGSESVAITYTSSRDIESIPISAPADSIHADEGFEFTAGTLRARDGRSRKRWVAHVMPDRMARDRTYPVLTRFDPNSMVIYLPSLVADPTRFDTSIEVEVPRGSVALSGSMRASRNDASHVARPAVNDRYLYIGPSAGVTDLGVATYVGADVSDPLSGEIRDALKSSLSDYAGGLVQGLPVKPVVVVSESSKQRVGNYQWRGDTTDNFMFIRFEGAGWGAGDAARRRIVDTFVRHEVFHFWNGWLVRQDVLRQHAWLSEGSAEFAALGSALRHGTIDLAYFDDAMTRNLNDCRELIGGASLLGPAGDWGRAPYACGVIVQWIGSLGPGNPDKAFRSFLAQWREVFDEARRGVRVYSFEDYFRRAASDAQRSAALDLLVRTEGEERWEALAPALSALGATVGTRIPDGPVLRTRLLMHLLAQACSGPYGFYDHDGFVTLDTGTRCVHAPTDPEVDAVEGQNLFDNALGAYRQVTERCAAGREISFMRAGIEAWRLRCTKPLAPPIEYRVGRGAAGME